jgi:hypothetical protein
MRIKRRVEIFKAESKDGYWLIDGKNCGSKCIIIAGCIDYVVVEKHVNVKRQIDSTRYGSKLVDHYEPQYNEYFSENGIWIGGETTHSKILIFDANSYNIIRACRFVDDSCN